MDRRDVESRTVTLQMEPRCLCSVFPYEAAPNKSFFLASWTSNLHRTLSGPPTSSIPAVLTLCAASRLWTNPISVRYFIPDATPVNMSISCITLSWPSCFCADRRTKRERRKRRARVREQRSDAVKKALVWYNNVLTGHHLFIWRKETNSH